MLKGISLAERKRPINAEYDYHKMAMGVRQVPVSLYISIFAIYITVILFYDESIKFSREKKTQVVSVMSLFICKGFEVAILFLPV